MITWLRILFVTLAFAPVLQGQSNVRAWHAKGQTFVVWDVGGQVAATWNVYRAGGALTGIGQGTLTGRTFIREAQGERLKLSGASLTWRVPDGAGGTYQLGSTEALFTYTPHAAATEHFAVVRHGQTVVSSTNRTAGAIVQGYDPVNDPVLCHRQAQLVNGAGHAFSIYAMWADGRDDPNDARPDFPVTANFAKNGAPHVFAVFEPTGGPVAGPTPVVVALHGGDSDGGYRRYQPGITAGDIGINMPSGLLMVPDDVVYRVVSITPTFSVDILHTLWMGWRTNWDPFSVYPSNVTLPPGDSQIVNYTMRRLDWMLQWLATSSPWNVDARRVSVMGVSMGGGGTSIMARWKPERFSSAVCFVPRMVGPSTSETALAAGNGVELLGNGTQNLPTNLPKPQGGVFGVNDVFQPQTLLSASQRDLPLMRFYLGRNDTSVVWNIGKVGNYLNINAAAWGAHLFWDSRVHGTDSWSSGSPVGQNIAEWIAPVQTAYASAPYQARYRSDQSFPAFFNDDQNSALAGRQPSMGNGDPTNGDIWGTWNGYYDWDQSNLSDTATYWAGTVFLTGLSSVSVDNYPGSSATASIAIRRPQRFSPAPGTLMSWRLRRLSDNAVLQSGTTTPDAAGVVSVTGLTLYKDPVRTRLEVFPPSQPPALGLGSSSGVVSTTLAQLAEITVPLSGAGAGKPQISINGLNGMNIILEYSGDLASWQTLASITLGSGGVTFSDVTAPGSARRFYRLRLP